MKIKEKPFGKTKLRYSPTLLLCVFACLILLNLSAEFCLAVSTKIFRQDSFTQFQKGKTKDVVISSKGTIQLGLSNETVVDKFDPNVSGLQPWSINCIAVNGSAVYFGTSPNGGIYSYSLGKLNKIYPKEISPFKQARPQKDGSKDDKKPDSSQKDTLLADEPNTPPKTSRTAETDEYLTNEHIFAMNIDISGHLLAAVSGK